MALTSDDYGTKTYRDAYFTPKAKPGKKKGKSKGNSKAKPSPAKAKAKADYVNNTYGQPTYGSYGQPTIGGGQAAAGRNPLSALFANGGGGNSYIAPTQGNYIAPTYGNYGSQPTYGNQSAPAGYGSMTSGSFAAGKPGGSAYNASVPHGTSPASLTESLGTHAHPALRGPNPNKTGPKTPEEILAELTKPYSGQGDTTDWAAAASKIYDPQENYIDDLEARARARAKESGKSIQATYDELARSIGSQAGGITSSYDTANRDTQGAFDEAYNRSQETFDNSRNGVADTLQRLGIEEAAPNTTQQGAEMQQLMQGIIGSSEQDARNLNTAGKQSALDYNSAMQSGSKIKGGDAQYGLTSQLNGFLNDLGLKRADIATQEAQWAAQQQASGADTAYNRWKDQRDFDYRAAHDAAALAAQGGTGGSSGSDTPPDLNKLDPIGQLNQIANNIYGNPRGAGNAVKAITDTVTLWGKNPSTTSLQDFVNTVVQHNPQAAHEGGDMAALIQLANTYWARFNNKSTPDSFATGG